MSRDRPGELPAAETLVRGVPGLTTVASLGPDAVGDRLRAEVAQHPQLVAQLSGPFGPVILVSGDEAAIASLEEAASQHLGSNSVFTPDDQERLRLMAAGSFSTNVGPLGPELDAIAGFESSIADDAAILIDALEVEITDFPSLRDPMNALLEFATTTCGLQLFR